MVGLRQRRSSPIARAFVQSLFDQAQSRCEQGPSRQLGIFDNKIAVHFSRADEISDLIANAFNLSAPSGAQTTTNLYVVRLSGDGIAFPDFEWAREWIEACEPIPTAVTSPYRVFFDRNQGVIYCYDEFNHSAVIVLRSAQEIDSRSLITPFRLLWSWIASAQSVSIVHAGAIALGERGILLAGPSGSGKSTLSFGVATSSSGLFAADDCVAVSTTRAHAVYSRVKLASDTKTEIMGSTVHRVPDHLPEAHQAKPYLQITGNEHWFLRGVELAAIVFPVIAGQTGHYRLEARQAQRMLTKDSQRELFGGSPRDTIRLAKLAGALPAYRLLLGDNLGTNIRALEDIVGR
ncbi:unannotated protein [freshwater metagenome]|uniref:Unannotated protein n=1 Tax=freshwater metagenome TaxID=449393 RepID=A0A6J6ES48_9ZZZZ